MDNQEKDWLQAAMEREATPKPLREGTVAEFCLQWGVDNRTYFYQMFKDEHKKKILEIALNRAKIHAPEVLEKLAQKAKEGDNKSIEMYLDYILKLAKNLDIKSDGKALNISFDPIFKDYGKSGDGTSKIAGMVQEK